MLLPVLFAATLFVSATLLFLIQPLIAKMILPLLGGMPTVWITCMLFFQTVLLTGYLYAHAVSRRLGTRRQALLHVGVLLVPALALPLLTLPLQLLHGESAGGFGMPPAGTSPVPWLLGLLLVTVGLPFFALSTTAPLLQRWFAHTGHPSANDPYFLYAASNLGSMLALLGYPAVLEPSLALSEQSSVWIAGYGLLALLVAACAFVVARNGKDEGGRMKDENKAILPAPHPSSFILHPSAPTPSVTLRRRLRWVALAFVPSGLLYGVTTYLSTDLAGVPLLWVIPLALYLLTFILAFSRRTLVPPRLVILVLPVLILLHLGHVLSHLIAPRWPPMLLHLVLFFTAALFCHGELARDRPTIGHLTEFYLWMSVGGVLGGVFNVLIAPLVFRMVAEYPLEIALACLFVPHLGGDRPRRDPVVNLGLPLLAGAVVAGLLALLPAWRDPTWTRIGLLVAPAIVIYLVVSRFTDRPLLFGLSTELVLLGGAVLALTAEGTEVYRERSFFGILRVIEEPKGKFVQLYHGSTCHGEQRRVGDPGETWRRPDGSVIDSRHIPRTYYHPSGPIGQVFDAFCGPRKKAQVALVGLGAGSLASYGEPGQTMTYYEIDPAVVWIAQDSGYFSFLADSRAEIRIVLGDARLSLAAEPPDRKFGLIVLDAFSSDAIPVHLLTHEALREVYLPRLEKGGLLAFHISNRYLDLRPVLGDLAQEEPRLVCRIETDDANEQEGKDSSIWVVMARKEADLGPLVYDRRWKALPGSAGRRVWRDDYSNLLRVFRWSSPQEGAGRRGR
jgi:hypothetical protein